MSSVTLNNLNAKFTRAQFYGKVVNISTENETSNFNSEALKAITSGDPIQIENKYERLFTLIIPLRFSAVYVSFLFLLSLLIILVKELTSLSVIRILRRNL